MSWDSYIDNVVAHATDQSGKQHADKVCIVGLNGGAWTTATHPSSFKLTTGECSSIANCFKNSDYSTFQSNGIHCEGVKYQFLREIDGMVMGKKKDAGAVTMMATKSAIVIAHTKEGQQQGTTNKAVQIIGDYLKSQDI